MSTPKETTSAAPIRLTNLYKIGRPATGPLQYRIEGVLMDTIRVGQPIYLTWKDSLGQLRDLRTSPVTKVLESTFHEKGIELMVKTGFSIYLVQFLNGSSNND
jgi:hypothetical protein